MKIAEKYSKLFFTLLTVFVINTLEINAQQYEREPEQRPTVLVVEDDEMTIELMEVGINLLSVILLIQIKNYQA